MFQPKPETQPAYTTYKVRQQHSLALFQSQLEERVESATGLAAEALESSFQ